MPPEDYEKMLEEEENYPLQYVRRLGWHEAFNSSVRNISSHASELGRLADCLEQVGNKELADKLWGLSLAIDADLNVANIAVDEYINEQLQASNKAIGNTLNAILEVAEITNRNSDDS